MTNHDATSGSNLLERARQGDRRALGELYDRHAPALSRYLRFHVADRADADDLLQRVFLKMIDNLPRLRGTDQSLTAWLFTTARHAVTDHNRTRHAHSPLEAAMAAPDPRPGPEERALVSASERELMAAMGRLTDSQREVLTLRFFVGLSPDEVGRVIRRRAGAVRALQFRALEALRHELGSEETRAE